MGLRQLRGLSVQLDLNAVGSRFGDNRQTVQPSADGTIGRRSAYDLANLAVGYEIRRERRLLEPYCTVKNAFDEHCIASRVPQGVQPGPFRQVQGDLRVRF